MNMFNSSEFTMSTKNPSLTPEQRIVSSSHLVSEKSPELSEFEFGLIIAAHAFNRWLIRCMGAAGVKDMTATDVLVLHHINHKGTEKRLADICFVLNVEDTHVVSYSLKKLVAAGLVKSERNGKEVLFSTTARGQALIERYREVREACLVASLNPDGTDNEKLADVASFLRFMSGMYDQASRAASSL